MILNVGFLKNFFFLVSNSIVRTYLKQLLLTIYRFFRIKFLYQVNKKKPEIRSIWKYIEDIMKQYLIDTRVWFLFKIVLFFILLDEFTSFR